MTSRISSEQIRAITAYSQQNIQQRQKSAETTARADAPTDRVDLSPQAKELAKDLAAATKIVRDMEATTVTTPRKAKVEEIARRIRQGTYQPKVREMAERMLPALRALDEDK
ncbi:MAG: flagellar biosynthesis anti-sigma factor FlgM [Symbiobacteriaceae bacterium]|nr:flagellar biosynthesis anti-sigma factor FlgM [Symbiobacteriaceae bacterium]